MSVSAARCDKCGIAYGVVKIAVLVAGRVNLSAQLCAGCLDKLLDGAR